MNSERAEMRINLPDHLSGRFDVNLRSTVNGQVQENRLTPEDLLVIEDGSVRTANTIVGGANNTDRIQGFEIGPTEEDRNIFRFRYQRPIHLANEVDGRFLDTRETLRVGPILEGMVRNVDGRAKEIVLYDVRKYS